MSLSTWAADPDSSCAEMKEQMDDASMMSTNWLDSAGQTFATAGTTTTCRSTWKRVSARDSPASTCDLWIESTPALMISTQ